MFGVFQFFSHLGCLHGDGSDDVSAFAMYTEDGIVMMTEDDVVMEVEH